MEFLNEEARRRVILTFIENNAHHGKRYTVQHFKAMNILPMQYNVLKRSTVRRSRTWRSVDFDALVHDFIHKITLPICSAVKSAHSTLTSLPSVDFICNSLDSTLCDVLDSHAPVTHKSVIIKNRPQWFNASILSSRSVLRRAERRWKRR